MLLILLDQYPRNAFRDTMHMYATDEQVRRVARLATARSLIELMPAELRLVESEIPRIAA